MVARKNWVSFMDEIYVRGLAEQPNEPPVCEEHTFSPILTTWLILNPFAYRFHLLA